MRTEKLNGKYLWQNEIKSKDEKKHRKKCKSMCIEGAHTHRNLECQWIYKQKEYRIRLKNTGEKLQALGVSKGSKNTF